MMKTSSVAFSDDSGVDLGWQTGVWSNNNKTVTWDHTTQFNGNTWYNITVTAGMDMANNNLVPGIAPNPFRFKTLGAGPQIIVTTPAHNAVNVKLDADVVVKFSMQMATSTVTYACTPLPAAGFTPLWSENDTKVTYSHVTDFEKDTMYNFTISYGEDLLGNPMMAGTLANPWSFTTIGDNPYIMETTPADGATAVALDADIVVKFNTPMTTSSVTFTCSPTVAFTQEWNTAEDEVTFSHTTDFAKNTDYTFEITAGTDQTNSLPLVVVEKPNPWTFTTLGDEPVIMETSPADGDTNIHLMQDVVITFSEPMNTATVMFSCTPDPGGWSAPSWDATNEVVTFSHSTPFTKNTDHTFQITAGKDMDGIDFIPDILNPFTFKTAGDNPIITKTTPADGDENVALNADIIVEFSKPMETSTVLYTIVPAITMTADWSVDKTEVTLSHATEFAKSTVYTFKITAGKDTSNYDILPGTIPNPFSFTTIGNNPVIQMTTPADNTKGVAIDAEIEIQFSKPMNTGTVTFTSDPSPAAGFSPSWNSANDIVTFSHSADFIKDTTYTVRIASGKDTDGNDLVSGAIPNPWSFRTVGDEPVIESTTPTHKQKDVAITQDVIIEFSEAMSTSSVTYTVTSDAGDPGGWTAVWSNGDQTLTLSHNDFAKNTKYQIKITGGVDLSSDALVTGPVANPFEFTTGSGGVTKFVTTLSTPANGATVESNTPTLTWDETASATSYYVYLSTDKAQVDGLNDSVMVEVTGTSYTPTTELEPGTTYYWAVVPVEGTKIGEREETRSFSTPKKETDDKDDDKEGEMDWLWILIIIIVIVVIVIIVVLVLRKKEPEPEPEEPREEIPPAEGAGPIPEGQMPPGEEMAAIPPPEAAAPPVEQYEAPPPVAEQPVAAVPPAAAPVAAEAAPAPETAVPPAESEMPAEEEPVQPDVEPV
jgi:hypothetical protein